MPENHVEPKHRSAAHSLLRLWPYVKPVRIRLFGAAAVAVVASCLGLVIPLVLKWIVDGPVTHHDPGGVWLGALYLLLLGIVEALLFGLRRWLVARPLAGVEASMRADLYRHLQRLPVAFHDRWPSGQLLSRGTTDLMLLRMFLAFPLTFLLVNATTIVAGFIILLVQQWTLGLVLLAPVVPLVILCSVFETKYAVVARKAQDQVGDLTTVVEESVLGIRIIKGFGRHRSQALAFRGLSQRLRGTELDKARLLAADLGVHHHHPRAGDRGGAGARHDPGRGRRTVGGHARRVPVDGAGAAVAGRVDRLPAGDEPGVGHGDRAVLRGDGRGGGA